MARKCGPGRQHSWSMCRYYSYTGYPVPVNGHHCIYYAPFRECLWKTDRPWHIPYGRIAVSKFPYSLRYFSAISFNAKSLNCEHQYVSLFSYNLHSRNRVYHYVSFLYGPTDKVHYTLYSYSFSTYVFTMVQPTDWLTQNAVWVNTAI